jgi:tRNA pseudouridine38-40 synthase
VGIQQRIEQSLQEMVREPVKLYAAGRTDSGVHAAGQTAHVDLPLSIVGRAVQLGLNDMLPHDIRIVEVREVADTFHARFDALEKSYVYRIWNDRVCDVFHHETFAHVISPLDETRMAAAASSLLGEHDFASYTVAGPEVSSTIRTLRSATVEREGNEVTLTFVADGFLRYMVRRMAGMLIEIGRGKLEVGAAAAALEPTFQESRWTAPSHGLTLQSVTYGGERP